MFLLLLLRWFRIAHCSRKSKPRNPRRFATTARCHAIYGVFGWCPDCGVHNSLQILTKNLELAKKELALAEGADKELGDHLIGDALENVVSAFDGFGREICAKKDADIDFQNLPSARRRVQERSELILLMCS